MGFIGKLTEEEKIVADLLLHPVAFSEIMFDHHALEGGSFTHFTKEFSTIRFYQYAFFSYDSLIKDSSHLSKRENFRMKEKAGTVYNLSGRGIGKTVCEKLNIIHSIFLGENCEEGIESYDLRHVNDVLEPIMQCFEHHLFLKKLKKHIKRGDAPLITTIYDLRFYGINANISGGLSAGDNFFGKHLKKLFIEEFSKENNIVYNKRIEAKSEDGVIINASGMCDFLKHSPAGRTFYDLENKKHIVNLPKFILSNWDDEEKKKAIRQYGSEDSINYRIYVLGQPIEEGMSAFDEQRIRACYTSDEIKHFIINKENYENYALILNPIIRPKYAEQIWIVADIGTSSQTKILVFSKTGKKFYYIYKITLHGLINPQLEPLFDLLISQLEANIVAVDAGDGDGRNLLWYLEEKYNKESLFGYQGSENIAIGVVKDENGNIKYDRDGNPQLVYEKQHRWGAQMIRDLFYEKRLKIPLDVELDRQITSVIAVPRSNGVVYEVAGENDHIWNALKVFGCAVWDKEDFVLDKMIEREEEDFFYGTAI